MHAPSRRIRPLLGLLFAMMFVSLLLSACATTPPHYALEGSQQVESRPPQPHPHALWVKGHYSYVEGKYAWVPGHWKR